MNVRTLGVDLKAFAPKLDLKYVAGDDATDPCLYINGETEFHVSGTSQMMCAVRWVPAKGHFIFVTVKSAFDVIKQLKAWGVAV